MFKIKFESSGDIEISDISLEIDFAYIDLNLNLN